MRRLRDLPLCAVLLALLLATAASLIAAVSFPAGPRGLAIALLGFAKAALVILGFMRLHRESGRLAGALLGYAGLLSALAGLRIVLTG